MGGGLLRHVRRVGAPSGRGVLPAIAAHMRTRRVRARASSEPRGVKHVRRLSVAVGWVSGVHDERRRRRRAVVVFGRTGVAGPYTHESRHILISNASHMYNERNRLTRQVSRAPLAPRAPRHRRVLSRPHKRVVLVERAPVRLGTLHEFSHRVVPLEPVRFRGPEQHV